MKSLIRKYVKIYDFAYLNAVCELLDILKYQRLDVPFTTGFIAILPSGEYGGFNLPPKGYEEINLKDILIFRDDKMRAVARKPEELPFIDDEPPHHDNYHIRPKPRVRMYATLVRKLEITVALPAPVMEVKLNFTVSK